MWLESDNGIKPPRQKIIRRLVSVLRQLKKDAEEINMGDLTLDEVEFLGELITDLTSSFVLGKEILEQIGEEERLEMIKKQEGRGH